MQKTKQWQPALHFSFQNASEHDHIPNKKLFAKWVKAALRVDTEATVRIVDETEAQYLNNTYRGKDYATNVLTFPLTEVPNLMGDIIICAGVVEKEAIAQKKSLEAHYAHLTIHGTLHLHGYDHETEKQAALMELIEVTTLAQLGYANPYLIT